jgi:trimeric autotransporter adhesin
MPVNTRIQLRRGNSSEWTTQTLYEGEIGFEKDTGRFKIGPTAGSTAWNSLPYAAVVPSGFLQGSGIYVLQSTNGASVTIGVSGLTTSYLSDFESAVQSIIDADAIDMQQVQQIIGNSGVVGGFGIAKSYNSGTGFTTLSATGLTHSINAGTSISLSPITTVSGNNIYTINVTGVQPSQVVGVTATATELNYVDTTPGTVQATKAVVVDSSKNITGFNNITSTGTVSAANINATSNLTVGGSIATTGNIIVGGDLTVQGTTTTVNSTTVEIGDNIILVNTSGLATGGFEVFDGSGYKSLIWDSIDNRWEFTGGNVYTSGTFLADTIQVNSTGLVTNLNADLLDGQHGSYYLNWQNTSNKPDPTITGVLTGDVAGTGTVTLTDLANGILSISTTIQPNSIALGTDTNGQYATTVSVAGTGLSATAPNANDGTAYTITSNATPSNVTGTLVARDGSGNFSAGTVSAIFSGNGANITDINASNISAGTLNSARLPTVSQSNTSNGPSSNLVSSISVDSYGRITGYNTTTHTLATTGVKGIASFDPTNFVVSNGIVSVKNSGINNDELLYNSMTFGSTTVSLGGTTTRFDGLSAISGTSAASPTTLTFCVIDGGTP